MTVGNRYAWKGPGWSDSQGRTNGRLTQRPNYTTPVYEFDTGGRSGFSKFYTVWLRHMILDLVLVLTGVTQRIKR